MRSTGARNCRPTSPLPARSNARWSWPSLIAFHADVAFIAGLMVQRVPIVVAELG
jgi:hypothetical protein